jgi:hypothetical protein
VRRRGWKATMIISHRHKFIFLKTKKTAGTSIELALSDLCGPGDIISPLSTSYEALRERGRGAQNWRLHGWWDSPRPFFKRRFLKFTAIDYGFYNHMPASEARELLGDHAAWRSYFKFAFERNPWDRQVSFYHHRYRRDATPPPFRDFIYGDRHARLNNYDIYSIASEVAVDFVGRFENLKEDLAYALSQVGLTLDEELPRAKSDTGRNGAAYRDYYDTETRGIVGQWYGPEIKLLGYAF